MAEGGLPAQHVERAALPLAPWVGLRGIMRMTLVPDTFFLPGAGVGGGSLGYANTLDLPARLLPTRAGADLADWRAELDSHYETAKKMLGVTVETSRRPTATSVERASPTMGGGTPTARARRASASVSPE